MDYRPPLADGQGPNNGTDIYLADLGDDGLLGYCAADPSVPDSALRAPAYCVIDNDFSAAQYEPPAPSGLPALQITVAHEFFHAIQFAYEYSDKDQWLKEGTAAWIEDEVYDSVNANRSYLSESQLQQPEIPLDHAGLALLGSRTRRSASSREHGPMLLVRAISGASQASQCRRAPS